jgi:hypothetical protein
MKMRLATKDEVTYHALYPYIFTYENSVRPVTWKYKELPK